MKKLLIMIMFIFVSSIIFAQNYTPLQGEIRQAVQTHEQEKSRLEQMMKQTSNDRTYANWQRRLVTLSETIKRKERELENLINRPAPTINQTQTMDDLVSLNRQLVRLQTEFNTWLESR